MSREKIFTKFFRLNKTQWQRKERQQRRERLPRSARLQKGEDKFSVCSEKAARESGFFVIISCSNVYIWQAFQLSGGQIA